MVVLKLRVGGAISPCKWCSGGGIHNSSRFVAGPVHLRLGNMYLNVVGTDRDPERALQHFHAAEYSLYKMVKYGDVMYKKSLREAIEGQAKARAAMADNLPDDEWTFDD